MSTNTENHLSNAGSGTRHSAFEEFSHDERRPAVLLLGALVIAAIFFAVGLFVGQLISAPKNVTAPQTKTDAPAASPANPSPEFP